MKKSYLTKLALLGLMTCSLAVNAGGPGKAKAAKPSAAPCDTNCQNFRLDLTGGWFKTFDAVPAYGFATETSSVGTSNTVTSSAARANADTKFNGAILLGYQMPSCPFEFNLSYWKVKSNGGDAAQGLIGTTRAFPIFGITASEYAQSDVDVNNDLLNLSVGTNLCISKCLTITPQFGVAYYRAKSDQNIRYDNLFFGNAQNPVAGTSTSIFNHSKFDGWGLSFGSSMAYNIWCKLSLLGSFTYYAFVGDTDANLKIEALLPDQAGFRTFSSDVSYDTCRGIVSLFQSEIALAYDFLCCDAYTGKVMVGYNIAKAFEASQANTLFVDDVSQGLYVTIPSNIGWYGPFVRLSFGF